VSFPLADGCKCAMAKCEQLLLACVFTRQHLTLNTLRTTEETVTIPPVPPISPAFC
jgi:hypothetical protein